MWTKTHAIAATAAAVALALAGCSSGSGSSPTPSAAFTETAVAGDIPDNQVYISVTSDGGAFTVKVPEGWSKSTSGVTTTYTDKLNSVSFAETVSAAAPTVQSVTSDVVPVLESSNTKFTLDSVAPVSRKGADGILVKYTIDSAPDSVTGKVIRDAVEQYLFWQGGILGTLTLAGPTSADNVDPWQIVSDSYAWLK